MREMRDSGVEWIGEIPKDWNCCKQKYRFTLINGRAFKDNEFEEDGTYRILRVGNLFSNPVWYSSSLELEPDKYCEKGDLIYAWSMSYGPYIWNEEKVIYHYHIWKTKLVSDMDKMFSYYYLQALTESIKSQTHETTMGFVTMGIMNNSYIAYPRNIKEQKKISDYLDAKCSKIDEIIEKQLSIIEKLKEYKFSIINEAVTQGINPDVNMKQSGYKWIGNIPKHWNMVYAKQLFSQRKDRAFEDDEQLTASQKYGIISQKEFMDIEGRQVMQVLKGEEILKHVEKGDFVISMRSFQGGLEYSEVSGKISSAYVMLIPNRDKVYDRYYKWLFKSKKYISALQGTSNLIRDGQALRFSNFVQVYLPSLDLDEQKQIADYLDDICPKIDNEIEKREKLLGKVMEYKKSLIYEVVTGKKEV